MQTSRTAQVHHNQLQLPRGMHRHVQGRTGKQCLVVKVLLRKQAFRRGNLHRLTIEQAHIHAGGIIALFQNDSVSPTVPGKSLYQRRQ